MFEYAYALTIACGRQWETINGAGQTTKEKEDEFRRHWSLKEVGTLASLATACAVSVLCQLGPCLRQACFFCVIIVGSKQLSLCM